MIAVENFKMFRLADIIAILFFAALWLIISLIISRFAGPQMSYILSLLAAAFLMSFAVHLTRKAGTATLFYIAGGMLTYSIDSIGAAGINKVIALAFAGLIFELVFLILKIEVKNVQLDIIAGTALSSACLPAAISLAISIDSALSMAVPVLNMMLLSFFVGIIGAVLSFLAWHSIRTTKTALRFEYR